MEAKLFTQTGRFIIPFPWQSFNPQRTRGSPVLAVLTRPSVRENISGLEAVKKGSKVMDGIDGSTRKTVYNDSWFDRVAVDHLSNNVQAVTGLRNDKIGYESLVQAATDASKGFDAIKQRELVLESLKRAIPVPMLNLIKILLPQSRFKREYFATFTTMFFAWLVGPCEVRESDFDGRKEKNVVHIKKCRFLEEANCVGMCTNLCKVPTQVFIKETMGMPVNMVPNFEDMSCEMIFGRDPPPLNEDPALKQPCYNLCKSKKNHKMECTA